MNIPKVFTIFVDGLPHNMNSRWLKNIFKSYGVIVDVYVSFKKRKSTDSVFGFVRFRHKVDAQSAISCIDGKLIKNNCLKVCWARFKRKINYSQQFQRKTPVASEEKRDAFLASIEEKLDSFKRDVMEKIQNVIQSLNPLLAKGKVDRALGMTEEDVSKGVQSAESNDVVVSEVVDLSSTQPNQNTEAENKGTLPSCSEVDAMDVGASSLKTKAMDIHLVARSSQTHKANSNENLTGNTNSSATDKNLSKSAHSPKKSSQVNVCGVMRHILDSPKEQENKVTGNPQKTKGLVRNRKLTGVHIPYNHLATILSLK